MIRVAHMTCGLEQTGLPWQELQKKLAAALSVEAPAPVATWRARTREPLLPQRNAPRHGNAGDRENAGAGAQTQVVANQTVGRGL
jgi:hypothetical protein